MRISRILYRASASRSFGAGMPPPLKGLKVVDLTRVLAGPYCTMLLSDLGADVIKVEEPKKGDDTRQWVPPRAPFKPGSKEGTSEGESAYFLSVNRGKRSIGLNFKDPRGLKILHQLIKDADILVENYLPGKLAKLGLGYEDVSKLNPGIIYASITGFGQTGPYATEPGYDVGIAAQAGLLHITGEPDRPPVKVGVAITDLTTGLYTQSAILAALLSRQQTGRGVWIDASLFECQIASLANIGSNWLIAGQEAKRHGTSHPSIAPYQVFPTLDGWIMVGAGNDGQFIKLATLLDKPEWANDAKYKTNTLRVANRGELITAMNDILKTATTADWLAKFKNKGIVVAPINNMEQTFSHPQAQSRQVTVEVDHPTAGKVKLLAPAITYNGAKMPITRPPPVLKQHTEEVLSELGYDDDDVKALKRDMVI